MKTVRGILIGLVALIAGCATAPKTPQARANLVAQARQTVAAMETADPSLSATLRSSYAYLVFPSVGEGGFIVGGTYGRGVVMRSDGTPIGYADLKAGKVGALAGGQTFDELVVFQDKAALDRLINQGLSFEGSASATALTAGVAASTNFRQGVAVFVKPRGGLMASAAIGGQSINYVPSSRFAGAPAPAY